jgi:hypothetical protein
MNANRFRLHLLALSAAATLSMSGCGEGGSETPNNLPTESDEMWEYYGDNSLYLPEDTHTNVIRKLIFLSESAPGVVEGFDLDNRTSNAVDVETCGWADRRDEAGREGIDNQLAVLFRVLSTIVEDTPQIAIQGAINEGRVLMMIEVEGVDDWKNDDQVTLRFFRGSGRPIVGNKGLISPFQTFHVDYSLPVSTVTEVALIDGEINAGPIDFEVPIDVLDANFPMRVIGGRIRVKIAEDGTFTGMIGGSINVDKVLKDFGEVVAGDEDERARPIFERSADLGRVDGVCTELSLAFGIEGDIAYAVHDAEKEADSGL